MILVVKQDHVIQRLKPIGRIILDLRIRRRRPGTHGYRLNLARRSRNRMNPCSNGRFIYRLRNLSLLLDSECFGVALVVSYFQEELIWPMAMGPVESL